MAFGSKQLKFEDEHFELTAAVLFEALGYLFAVQLDRLPAGDST